MKKNLKAAALFYLIAMYLVHSFITQFLFVDKKSRRGFFLRNVQRYVRAVLAILNIETILDHPEKFRADQNYLIVANHLSYLDALILGAMRPVCFITSQEMRKAPGLGQILQMAGCVFVERRNKQNIKGEIGEIVEALQDGFNVVVFAEATSTNGAQVLPFKRSLLAAAVESKKPILPLCIQYEEIDGKKVNSQNRDLLCWYGTMDFAPHFYALAGLNKIKIRVKILDEIPVDEQSTRDTLVEKAYAAVSGNYTPII